MAKKSMVARDEKRIKLSQRARNKRNEVKTKIKSPHTSEEERQELVIKLNKAPRNESCSRARGRCRVCGRPRSVYKKFGLCRLCLRIAFNLGNVPGLRKASW